MKNSNLKNAISKVRQRGQGMVEYIIIVAVIALGSIAVYAAFGDVLRSQVSNAASVLNGDNKDTAKGDAAAAKAKNNVNKDLKSY